MFGSSVRASAPASSHGRRCSGVAITAVSLRIAIGLSSWSTITTARARLSSARLIASASGVSAATETALRASRLACKVGSRSRNLVALMAWPAPVHMNAAITASHSTMVMSPPAPVTAPVTNGITNRLTASTRPAQAAAMVAIDWRPDSFQITARSIRPPSSGRPGSRLKIPTTRLAQRSWLTSVPPMVSGGTTCIRPYPAAARTSDSAGPAADTRNSRPGVGGSCSISENPPSG